MLHKLLKIIEKNWKIKEIKETKKPSRRWNFFNESLPIIKTERYNFLNSNEVRLSVLILQGIYDIESGRRQRYWQNQNDIVYLLIGVILMHDNIKKKLIGINWNNILESILIHELLLICLDVSLVATGQVLNIMIITEAMLALDNLMKVALIEIEHMFLHATVSVV
jgi:hypothetical protein